MFTNSNFSIPDCGSDNQFYKTDMSSFAHVTFLEYVSSTQIVSLKCDILAAEIHYTLYLVLNSQKYYDTHTTIKGRLAFISVSKTFKDTKAFDRLQHLIPIGGIAQW